MKQLSTFLGQNKNKGLRQRTGKLCLNSQLENYQIIYKHMLQITLLNGFDDFDDYSRRKIAQFFKENQRNFDAIEQSKYIFIERFLHILEYISNNIQQSNEVSYLQLISDQYTHLHKQYYLKQSRMVNYNMGRYYAWQNLSKYIKNALHRHFYIPRYKFTYIAPKVHTNIQFLPFEEWKANKNFDKSEYKYTLAGVAFITYLISKFVYQVLEDDDQGYFNHVRYPVLSQSIVWIYADIVDLTNPFFEIMPKDRYQVAQVYPRLYDLVFKPQKRIEEQDRKALELRQAIKEYDKSHQ